MRDIKKQAAGQMTRLERFIHTLQEQDDTMFLMRKVVKWVCYCVSVFCCGLPMDNTQPQGLQLSTVIVGMNIFYMGVLSMVYTVDSPVAMKRGVVLNLYECLKYFPVGRMEIYSFLRKRLMRFLGLYGFMVVLIRLIVETMADSLSLGSLIFPLVVWLLLALVGFSMIRVRLAWRYRKKVRSL